jgi:hypothetical protein
MVPHTPKHHSVSSPIRQRTQECHRSDCSASSHAGQLKRHDPPPKFRKTLVLYRKRAGGYNHEMETIMRSTCSQAPDDRGAPGRPRRSQILCRVTSSGNGSPAFKSASSAKRTIRRTVLRSNPVARHGPYPLGREPPAYHLIDTHPPQLPVCHHSPPSSGRLAHPFRSHKGVGE